MAAVLPNQLLDYVINPKTGLPVKGDRKIMLKDEIKKTLRILDEQNAVNRYTWYNLPSGLNGQLLERMLYYKGQLAFFFMKENGQFYLLPYSLSGKIDVYGRFLGITPLIFAGSNTTDNNGKEKQFINGMVKKPIYDIANPLTEEQLLDGCVLLFDYTQQLNELNVPRQILQEPIVDAMSEAFPLARTSLISNSGVRGVRVAGEDDAGAVLDASKTMEKQALNGNPLVPITSKMEFQELTGGAPLKSEEYLVYMQALDNYRLSLYGLTSGGVFTKKAHMLESEQEMNSGHAKLAYDDGLIIRQRFCDIVNSIWGLGIWCEPSESVIAADINGDGLAIDKIDQSGTQPGDNPEQMVGGEE